MLELLEGLRQCWASLPLLDQQLKRRRCRGSFMLMSRWKNTVKPAVINQWIIACRKPTRFDEADLGIMSSLISRFCQTAAEKKGLYIIFTPKILTPVLRTRLGFMNLVKGEICLGPTIHEKKSWIEDDSKKQGRQTQSNEPGDRRSIIRMIFGRLPEEYMRWFNEMPSKEVFLPISPLANRVLLWISSAKRSNNG